MRRGYRLLSVYLATGSTYGLLPKAPSSVTSSLVCERSMSTSENTTEDPGEQSWRSLLEVSIAKSRKIRGSNYVQLSTVENGEPRCRTIVFRGFMSNLRHDHTLSNVLDDKECVMKTCTDLRSKKVDQNQHQPIAELVWWFPKTSEQYRIRGPMLLIGNDQDDKSLAIARKELWGNMGDSGREGFLGQSVPGEAYQEDTTEVPPGGRDAEGKVVLPPDNFLLMLFDPTDSDYLRLTGAQYRQLDSRGPSGWSMKRVNP